MGFQGKYPINLVCGKGIAGVRTARDRVPELPTRGEDPFPPPLPVGAGILPLQATGKCNVAAFVYQILLMEDPGFLGEAKARAVHPHRGQGLVLGRRGGVRPGGAGRVAISIAGLLSFILEERTGFRNMGAIPVPEGPGTIPAGSDIVR